MGFRPGFLPPGLFGLPIGLPIVLLSLKYSVSKWLCCKLLSKATDKLDKLDSKVLDTRGQVGVLDMVGRERELD